MRTERVPFACGAARGYLYGPLPSGMERELPLWLAGVVEGALEIKPGRVWRRGEWLVKLFPPRRAATDWLRRSPAVRAAQAHARLEPVRTPRPLVALEDRRGPSPGASLLVSEWVEGEFLHRLWRTDPAGRSAFPHFMAAMHARSIFHGDFHVRNALWNGGEWVLLDLDGLRHPLRRLRPRRLITDQWARIFWSVDDPEGMRESFFEYLRASGRRWEPEDAWRRVLGRAEELAPHWDPKRPGGGP